MQNIIKKQEKVLFVSDEVYKERIGICKSCDKFDEFENKCVECGCYIPAKAKIILDSCPLTKWDVDKSSWEEKFEQITQELDNTQESLQTTFVPVEDENLRSYRDQLGNCHRAHRQSPHRAIISASTTET